MNKKTILVIEDERPLLEAIKIKLEQNNFEVVSCRSVEQAKNYTNELEKIDLIWLDHYLIGKENGLDFIAYCKEDNNIKCKANKYFVKSNHKLEEIIKEINKIF